MRLTTSLITTALLGFGLASPESSGESIQTRSLELSPKDEKQPNIVLFLVDDLDSHMSKLDKTLPSVKKNIIDQGTSFPRHYCTVSLCCPARVSILTGQTAHNHNVTDVAWPSGGYPKFVDRNFNDDYLPIWFQDAGYNTYYTGKMMNELTIENWQSPPLNGWTDYDILLDPFSYDYLAPAFGRKGQSFVRHQDEYITDLVSEKARGFLDDALASDKPFFLGIAPSAPHSEIIVDLEAMTGYETFPRPAARHKGRFADDVVPRGPNFNPDEPSGASWIKELPQLNQTEVDYGDTWQRGRLEALLAVDEMIDSVFAKLEEANILENTYVIFTSDNGFHISQHRLTPGKTCGFEEDINVPFYVRGPGISKGEVRDVVSAHIDLAPTLLEMAGISQRDTFDGRPMPLYTNADTQAKREHATVEMWRADNGHSYMNGTANTTPANATYKSVRLLSDDFNYYYSVWCSNERQLYDLNTDPYQMSNMLEAATDSQMTGGISANKLAERLDALLYVLKSCRGDSCRYPWKALMPSEDVSCLSDALKPEYDEFFSNLTKVSYTSCQGGYIVSEEGPQFETWPENNSRSLEGRGALMPRSLVQKYMLMA